MKRNELLNQVADRTRTNNKRVQYEREILTAMPEDLDIERVYCGVSHTQSTSSSQGVVVIEVDTFAEAIALMKRKELEWTPTRRVKMMRPEQTFVPTISFYPASLIKDKWQDKHNIIEIYPVLFQMLPMPGQAGCGTGQARVFLEWFTKIRAGVFASITVYVKYHGCTYKRTEQGGWCLRGVPVGRQRWVSSPKGNTPPSVTVYWDWPTLEDHDNEHLIALSRILTGNEHREWVESKEVANV